MGRGRGAAAAGASRTFTYAPAVRIDPLGLFANSPRGFASHVGWRYENRGGEHWVRPDLGPGRHARHLRAYKLASSQNAHAAGAYARMASLPRYGIATSIPKAVLQRRVLQMKAAGTVPGAVAAFELACTAAAEADLAATVAVEFRDLLKVLPSAALWLVQIDPLVNHRLTAVKGLVAVARTPELFKRATGPATGPVFQSASGQLNSLLLGAEYLIQSALSVAAPFVIGSGTPRAGGLLVVLYDEPLDGRDGIVPGSLLATAGTAGFASAGVVGWTSPPVTSGGIDAWFTWYIESLNSLVGEILDPRPYADAAGVYQPSEHLALLLTIERLFASIVNVLAQTGREEYVAKVLAFSALDCLESLPGHPDRVSLLPASSARSSLDILTTAIPIISMGLIERLAAVPDNLKAIADGFFQPSSRRPGEICIRSKDGVHGWVGEDLAVASYLNLVRNGTHGYNKFVGSPREEDLLLGHDGTLPRDVADIPVLHGLRLLVDPVAALGRTVPAPA